MMGRYRWTQNNLLDTFNDHILLIVLDKLQDRADRQAWCLVCKTFLRLAVSCRKCVRLLSVEVLPSVLRRYNNLQGLNLSCCLRVTDDSLLSVAHLVGKQLKSISLAEVRTFTEVGLAVLAQRCKSLLELDLSHCYQVNDLHAVAISRIESLQSLKLVSCREITDTGLYFIAASGKRLTSLNLRCCMGITDLSLAMIGANCKELRTLDLSYTEITNTGLASVTNLELLENLSLVACHGVDDEGLTYLKNDSKSLQVLDVSRCQSVSHMGIMSLVNGSFPLQQLTLPYCLPITDTLLKCFQKFEGLQSIRFDGCDVGGADLACIGKGCMALRELSLSKCQGVTDAGLSAALIGCRGLLKLDLTCCRELTDVALSSIAMFCKNLVSLKMENCSLVTENGLTMLGDACCYLEELDFTDSIINDAGLNSISKCMALRTLKLGFCLNFSDKGLVHIASSCTNLRELDVYRSTGVGDEGVACISIGCPRLKTLNLSYCTSITDTALQSIARLRELQILEMRSCILVSSTGISAVAMGCQCLLELDVKRCALFDDCAALALAKYCTSLRQLNLSYCAITDRGLAAIAKLNCLYYMALVNLKNVSVGGFAEALLVAGRLKKVKLLACLEMAIPPKVIQLVESRGCRFAWMDKPILQQSRY